jgi:hypothetical protein
LYDFKTNYKFSTGFTLAWCASEQDMIVELMSDLVGKLDLDWDGNVQQIEKLQPLFTKLCLPLPNKSQRQPVREGGFNLFLNQESCVIRLFNTESCAHIYHEKALPYIGCVKFPQTKLQIMPGVKLCTDQSHDDYMMTIFNNHFGISCDASATNLGYMSPDSTKACDLTLLDTVSTHIAGIEGARGHYEAYLKAPNCAGKIIDNYERYADLQQDFYEAWTGKTENKMIDFWSKLRIEATKQERLYSGWQDKDIYQAKALNEIIEIKGNIVEMSQSYEAKMQRFMS